MANIDTYLQAILEAVYGEEVRGSIHDAIEAMNNEIEVWTGLQDGSVTTRKIASEAVTTEKIDDGAVTFGKLSSGAQSRVTSVESQLDGAEDDPLQGVFVTNAADSVRTYDDSGWEFQNPLQITSRFPVAPIAAGLSGSSSAIFYKLKRPITINSNKYNPFSVYIKLKDGYTGSMVLTIGTISGYNWNSTYSAINWINQSISKSGFLYKVDSLINDIGANELKYLLIRGDANDLVNIDYITYYDSPFALDIANTVIKEDIYSIKSNIADINKNQFIAEMPLNNEYNCRYFNNGSWVYHPFPASPKFPVSEIVNGLTGDTGIFYALNEPIKINNNNYNPFSVFIKVKDSVITPFDVIIGTISTLNWNSNISAINWTVATVKGGGNIAYKEDQLINQISATDLPFVIVKGDAANLVNIEYVSYYDSAWAAPLLKNDTDQNENDYSFIAYGDSLTQGSGGSGTTYAGVIHSAFPNSKYVIEAAGGDGPPSIAYRANAGEILIPANTDPTIAFTPDVNFGSKPFGIPPYTTSKTFKVYIEGEEYTAHVVTSGTMTIDGCPTKNYPRIIRYEHKRTADVTIIWMGTNSTRIFADVEPYIDSVISEAATNYYLVLGLTVDEDNGKIATYNTAAKAKYREHFVDLKDFLVNYGLTVMNMSPTSEDTERIAAGNIPSSLLADNVHFTADGYTAIGKCIIDKIYGLGYDRFLA